MILTHYTDARNLDAIRESGILQCALSLMTPDEVAEYSSIIRPQCLPLSCGAALRDQQPMLRRKIQPTPEEVKHLNEHVFFWAEPDNGKRNFERVKFHRKYKRLNCFHLGLHCSLDDLRAKNSEIDILYAPHNLGAKENGGRYRLLQLCEEKLAVEVVVRKQVRLPKNTQEEYETGKWRNLFCS